MTQTDYVSREVARRKAIAEAVAPLSDFRRAALWDVLRPMFEEHAAMYDTLRHGLTWVESDGEPDNSDIVTDSERSFRESARAVLHGIDGVTP